MFDENIGFVKNFIPTVSNIVDQTGVSSAYTCKLQDFAITEISEEYYANNKEGINSNNQHVFYRI